MTFNAFNPERTNVDVERIYLEWEAALAHLEELPPERLDEGVDALLSPYAKDAIIEPHQAPLRLLGLARRERYSLGLIIADRRQKA